ncbi:hypothetical protein GLOIN_2v1867536 [Rhizophagus irregularis DAOM 181602=DAOM 197198]|nr:hypothetical protein GLOIN_2v1867536 [Rhizophagus irregularis DAOM 181602=DAOM 197198]
MACTKIFSGDFPEIISDIIQYFQYDSSTLYSCILVNRLWCRSAIPLLWENPFLLQYPKNYRYIEVYLYNLNDDYKTQLNEYGINNDLFPSNTLFNYPSFIQHLDTRRIGDSIEKWVAAVTVKEQSIVSEIVDHESLRYTKMIYKSLFRLFIENEANIHTFKFTMLVDNDLEYFKEIFELILQNQNLLRNIKNLTLCFEPITENITKFMKYLYSNCNSVLSLYFLFPSSCNSTTERHFSRMIDSQKNLKKVYFSYNCNFSLYHSLLSLKNPNCMNTLRTIIFYYINFKNIVVLNEVFEQLNCLESIHILYCFSLDSNFTQQIISMTKPFKLKSLIMDEVLIEPLQLLLQKSGEYLENFGLEHDEFIQQVSELIIKYCKNINFLQLDDLNDDINMTLHLIENINHHLNYLTIESYELSSIILQNLGQVLPPKLEYLNLILTINKRDFEIFIKNFQNTYTKKLLISNVRDETREKEEEKNILPYIKEYIMKKKRAEYFAFQECFTQSFNHDDLFSMEDEVKEFKLYNIIVQNYNDLNIVIHEFINEIEIYKYIAIGFLVI